MSFSNSAFVSAQVICWLSSEGVLDAVQNGIIVKTDENGDKYASFGVDPNDEEWPTVFDLRPSPIVDSDGDVLSVTLTIGRKRQTYISHEVSYQLDSVGASPPIVVWEIPEITTSLGEATLLDVCPSLDGLLEMEIALIEKADTDRARLSGKYAHLIDKQWQPWVMTHGFTNARILLAHLENLRIEADVIAKTVVGAILVQEKELRSAINRAEAATHDSPEHRLLLAKLMSKLDSAYWELYEFERVLSAERKKLDEFTDAYEWAIAHGSTRLRKAVDAGVLNSSLAVYRDERLAAERPGWHWWRMKESPIKGIINPSEKALDALMKAREVDKDASLNFIQKVGIFVVSNFLGRYIVLDVEIFEEELF